MNFSIKILLTLFSIVLSAHTLYSKGYQPGAVNGDGGGTVCQYTPMSINAVIDGVQCSNGGGSIQSTGTIQWYVNTVNSNVGGTAVGTPIAYTTNDNNTTTWPYSVDVSNSGTLYYYFIITWDSNGDTGCTGGTATSNTVEVTVTAGPTQANAGADQSTGDCSTTVSLNGNTITTGTGTWSVTPAGPTPQAPYTINDENAIFENLVAGTEYTFTWTSTNGGCSTSDDMVFNSAGPGCVNYCTPSPAYSNSSDGYISNVNLNSGEVDNTTPWDAGYNDFTGLCATISQGETINIEITITRTSTFSMVHVFWIDWNGNGIFEANEEYSLGSNTTTETYTQSITAPCDAVAGDVVMRVATQYNTAPSDPCAPDNIYGETEDYCISVQTATTPVASAGPDQTISCTSSTTLDASASSVTDGFWSLISGTGSITDASLQNTTVTGLSNGTSVFQWTSEGNCATDEDLVSIDISGLPDTPVSAGDDIFTCTQGATLNGSDPSPYTGQWIVTNTGGGTAPTFSPSINDPNASISNLSNATYTLEWQVTTTSCGTLSDEVQINFGSLPSPDAGSDQTICPSNAVMNGNDFTGAIGTWSVVSGPGTPGFIDENDPNTLIYGLEPGVYDLAWTVSGGGCAGTPSDNVILTVNNCTEVINHDPTSDQSFTGCNFTYTDDGGAAGNYSNNINQTWTTFCPDDPNAFATITLTEESMLTYDYIVIYDDDSPSAPIIGGIWDGTAHPALGTTITSSTGCLYVQANSNASSVSTGWEADIGCTSTAGVQTQDYVQVNNCGGGGGITVCSSGAITAESNTASNPPDLGNQNQGCLGSQEGASNTWVYINVVVDGWVSFELDPPGGQDYDYAIWGPYDGGYACPSSTRDEPIRCSWASNGGSGCNSVIGLGIENMDGNAVASGDVSEGGFCAPSTNEGWTYPIYASAGDVYVLLFQNYGNNNSTFDFALNNDLSTIPAGESFAGLGCEPVQPLPIELLTFEGEHKNYENHLSWTTVSEVDNAYFIIEKSYDGYEWEELTKVDGAGFSNELKNYSTIDRNPAHNVTYYQLLQVDYDGTTKKYKTISVVSEPNDDLIFGDLFPNPTSDEFYFTYAGDNFDSPIELEVINSFGQVISTKSFSDFNNSQGLNLNVSNLSKGSYMVKIHQGEKLEVKRLIVM